MEAGLEAVSGVSPVARSGQHCRLLPPLVESEAAVSVYAPRGVNGVTIRMHVGISASTPCCWTGRPSVRSMIRSKSAQRRPDSLCSPRSFQLHPWSVAFHWRFCLPRRAGKTVVTGFARHFYCFWVKYRAILYYTLPTSLASIRCAASRTFWLFGVAGAWIPKLNVEGSNPFTRFQTTSYSATCR